MPVFLNTVLFYSSIAIFCTVISGLIPVLGRWKEDHLHGFVSFSAGILLATAFLHLLPDTLERTSPHTVGFFILASFLGLFILEKFVMLHPCEETHCDYHTVGITAFVGMIIHTFFDGFALGAAIKAGGTLPRMVFFALMAHKIPSSFALGSILCKAKWPKARIALFILIFASIIPLGTVISLNVLNEIGGEWVGVALALSLGTFLYISTSDFLPEVHHPHGSRLKSLIYFLSGIGLMAFLALGLPH